MSTRANVPRLTASLFGLGVHEGKLFRKGASILLGNGHSCTGLFLVPSSSPRPVGIVYEYSYTLVLR
jgi:hypothetical protein